MLTYGSETLILISEQGNLLQAANVLCSLVEYTLQDRITNE